MPDVCRLLGIGCFEATAYAVPLSEQLHCTTPLPLELTVNSVSVTTTPAVEYGDSTVDEAPRMACMFGPSMLTYCEARSVTVRVASVVLNLTESPSPTSTPPRYKVSMNGRMIANSTAETPSRSRAKRRRAA